MNKYTNKAKERLLIIKEHEDKATDLDIILREVFKLPYGQLKKVLTEEVLVVLEKYGYKEEVE